MLKTEVHLSTAVLAIIGLFDLVSSFLFFSVGLGEGNPLFSWLLSMGRFPFAIGKIIFLGGPILLLEYVRKSHPRTAEIGTWVAFGLYCLILLSHLVRMVS